MEINIEGERIVNRKDRAINLGLKINSLKGNLSVAKSVITDLEQEISSAVIDNEDKKGLLVLYRSVVKELMSVVSPSVNELNRINQVIEDTHKLLTNADSYIQVDKIDGSIISIEEQLKNKVLEKEHKASLHVKTMRLRETQKKKIGLFLKRNFEELLREINDECGCDSPYHVSVLIKGFNNKIKKIPLFSDDRHELQALLDTNWQRACREIKELKESEKD